MIKPRGTSAEEISRLIDDVASLSRENTKLRAENEALKRERYALRKGIGDAFEYANGRQWEWGSRAETTFEILERALRGEGEK